ncbi:MAG: hypothetical protein ILO42_10235 [Clostridia bacterium]|nr:hypothetical protein [Clostridia bacterium]
MRTPKRYVCLIVSLLILISVFASCARQGEGDATTVPVTGPVADVTEDTDSAETTFNPAAVISATDLENHVFKILSPVHDWAIVEMTCEDITGDLIKDAICERQLRVEERLNCKIEENVLGSNYAATIRTVAAGSPEDAYDLCQMTASDAYTLFLEGYLYDQAKIGTMNLDNPWWEKRFNDEVNLGGKRYVSFGNESLIFYSSFYLFVFNKQMIEDYEGLESPYDLVKNNQWTWDKAYEMMKTVASDGGDGSCDPGTDDILGITGHINHSRNLIFSSGISICQRDDEGMLTYDGLSENYVDAFSKFTRYFITDSAAAIAGAAQNKYAGYQSQSGVKNYISVFIEDKSLFLTTGTNEIMQIREGTTEYGIVVVPKYDANQERFVTPVYSAAEGIVIPSATLEPERSGLFAEALGAYSYNNIIDKHIRIVLHYRAANDPTAIEMINLAYENGLIDVAMAHNFGQCTTLLNNLNVQGATEVTRVFDQAKTRMKNQLNEAREELPKH